MNDSTEPGSSLMGDDREPHPPWLLGVLAAIIIGGLTVIALLLVGT